MHPLHINDFHEVNFFADLRQGTIPVYYRASQLLPRKTKSVNSLKNIVEWNFFSVSKVFFELILDI